MNSFSNMNTTDKTFGSVFQVNKNQETIDKYNNAYKDTKNSIDANMFEKTYLVEEQVQMPQIDYDTNKDAQKQIVIQKNKTNVLAETEAFMDAGNYDETNPIFHDGKLRQKQRTGRVRLQEEVDKVLPGLDTKTITQRKIVKEINSQLQKEVKKLNDNSHPFEQKPIDLEYSRKVDVDRHMYKRTFDNTMKVSNDLNNFEGKGKQENDPKKRGLIIPKMGFIQQQQTMDVPKPEIVQQVQRPQLGPNFQTHMTQTFIPFDKLNIQRLVSMPSEVGKFVMENTRGKRQESYAQPAQSLQTIMPFQTNAIIAQPTIKLETTKNIPRPNPVMQYDQSNSYIHQASNNVGGNISGIPKNTGQRVMKMNQPGFHELASQNAFSQNRGLFSDIQFEGM